jgi:hypothetical protein
MSVLISASTRPRQRHRSIRAFHFAFSPEHAPAGTHTPSIRPPGSVCVNSLRNAFGVDLASSAVRRSTWPRGSGAGRQKAKRYSAEQRPLWATRWQLNANACYMFDHARPNLDQALPDRRELSAGKWSAGSLRAGHASARTRRCGERIRGLFDFTPLDEAAAKAAMAELRLAGARGVH